MRSEVFLRFFGQRIRVICDSSEVAQALGLIYERQLTDSSDAEGEDVRVLVETTGGPRVIVGGRSVRAPSPDLLLHYAHLVLVNAAAASASDAQVLHGGAVERDGRAIAIVAHSGGGKTTTAIALAQRGWRILSDDFAVLDRDGYVEPFPRRLNLTDDSLGILGLTPPRGAVRIATSAKGGKWMVDAEEIVPHSIGGLAPLRALFVMEPHECRDGSRRDATPSPVEDATEIWRMLVDHVPDGLEEELRAMRGVVAVRREVSGDGTVLELSVSRESRIVSVLDETLASFDVSVLWARKAVDLLPAPGPRPCVAAMPLNEAVAAVLPHDLGLSGRRFLHGTDRSDVAAAWLNLATAFSRLRGRAYRLWPGDVSATVDVIEAHAEPGIEGGRRE